MSSKFRVLFVALVAGVWFAKTAYAVPTMTATGNGYIDKIISACNHGLNRAAFASEGIWGKSRIAIARSSGTPIVAAIYRGPFGIFGFEQSTKFVVQMARGATPTDVQNVAACAAEFEITTGQAAEIRF